MSYVSTRTDIKDAWEEFYAASEHLGNVLHDAAKKIDFTQRRVLIMLYLEAQLKADRFKLESDFTEVIDGNV